MFLNGIQNAYFNEELPGTAFSAFVLKLLQLVSEPAKFLAGRDSTKHSGCGKGSDSWSQVSYESCFSEGKQLQNFVIVYTDLSFFI